MAIELCSESCSICMSPRISFSYDLCQADAVPVEQYHPSRSSSPANDFDFCVYETFYQDITSSADELFCNGKILPIQIKKKIAATTTSRPPLPPPPPPPPKTLPNPKKESPREIKRMINEVYENKQNTKSFWRFNRSTSLNCGSGYARSLCPLPLLSRSNSTGSVSNAKRSALSSKDANNWHKHHHHHHHSVAPAKSSHSSSSSSYQKPPLKKTYGSYSSNGVRINPVLNVPTPSLFGLGSIFSNGAKDRINKKK